MRPPPAGEGVAGDGNQKGERTGAGHSHVRFHSDRRRACARGHAQILITEDVPLNTREDHEFGKGRLTVMLQRPTRRLLVAYVRFHSDLRERVARGMLSTVGAASTAAWPKTMPSTRS